MAKLHTVNGLNESQVEIKSIPFDHDRLEVVKKILEQNQMILNFILSEPPNLNINWDEINSNLDDWMRKFKYG